MFESNLDVPNVSIPVTETSWAGTVMYHVLNTQNSKWRESIAIKLIQNTPRAIEPGIVGEAKYHELVSKIIKQYRFDIKFFDGYNQVPIPDCRFVGNTINLGDSNEIIDLLIYLKLDHKKQRQNRLSNFYKSLRDFDYDKNFQDDLNIKDLQQIKYLNTLFILQKGELNFISLLLVYIFYKYSDNYALATIPKITINYDFIWTEHKHEKTGILWYIDDPSIQIEPNVQSKGIYFVLKQENNNTYQMQKINNLQTLMKLIEMHKTQLEYANIPY